MRLSALAQRNLESLRDPLPQILKNVPDNTSAPILAAYGHRMGTGGDKCDGCRKTLDQLGVQSLNCCQRCKKVYFCSKECQGNQWRAGHKKACRKPDQMEEGDIMMLSGLSASPEFNGRLVHFIGPAENNPDRLQVKLVDNRARVISMTKDKLKHIRPAI